MFCPHCGNETRESSNKFCKQCGTNLVTVQKAIEGELSSQDLSQINREWQNNVLNEQRKAMTKERRKSSEQKRLEEIKGGVITSVAGLAIMIFLYAMMHAIAGGRVDQGGEILRAIPFVGLIPFLIGIGIVFNGLVVSKRIVELKRKDEDDALQSSIRYTPDTSPMKRLAEPSHPVDAYISVTETTTTKLQEPVPSASESTAEKE